MIAGSSCDCLVCRLEKSLLAEFGDAGTRDNRLFITPANDALSAFPTYLDLIAHLHAPADASDSSSTDNLLLALLKQHASAVPSSLSQRLLLLAFIPTIHRTASQITTMFPSLARDDISQQVLSLFLEFLPSAELRTRRSHLAFTIARKLRRSAFRWAIRESRRATSDEAEEDSAPSAAEVAAEEPLPAEGQLQQFLDRCEDHGWLSFEERHLLVQFKIEGASCLELSRQNGHSAVAIQRRIQRLLDRLRRVAQMPRREVPRQLRLFPR